MTKQEIIDYLYENHVRGYFTIEEMAEDIATPTGEWIMDNEHTKNPLLWYKCNLCSVYHSPTNFCPNCGADMRGKEA